MASLASSDGRAASKNGGGVAASGGGAPPKKLSYEESLAIMFRERLTNFYKAYDASKVSEVDKLLEKYAGKEEGLFKALVKKYGPEPEPDEGGDDDEDEDEDEDGDEDEDDEEGGAAQPKSAASSKKKASAEKPKEKKEKKKKKKTVTKTVKQTAPQTFEERLVAFYTKYEPAKVGNIAKIMHKYAGAEEKLFETLVKKYGKEPKPVKVIEVEVEEEEDDDEEDEEDDDDEEDEEDGEEDDDDDDDDDEDEEEEDAGGAAASDEGLVMGGRFTKVVYCGVCKLPPEYCEYGPGEEAKCKEWIEANYPRFFTDKLADAAEGMALNDEDEDEDEDDGKSSKKKKKSKRGGGPAKKAVVDPKKQKVTVTFSSRGGKKIVTHVVGLQYFETVTMGKELTKALGKRFACATSIKDTAAGEKEVQIQGDVRYEIEDVLESICQVPRSKVTVDSGTGVKVKKPKEIAPQQRPVND